ncbi:MAG: hypothetical protein R2711_09665 [Acidimicrobiales bacterium]
MVVLADGVSARTGGQPAATLPAGGPGIDLAGALAHLGGAGRVEEVRLSALDPAALEAKLDALLDDLPRTLVVLGGALDRPRDSAPLGGD